MTGICSVDGNGHHQLSDDTRLSVLNCPICSFSASSREELVDHFGDSHDECVVGTCKTCGQSFPASIINQHVLRCKGCFVCKQCSSTFATSEYLQRHIKRKHSLTVRHNCNICGRSLASKSSLVTHMRLHNGEAPYSCTMCVSQFVQLSQFHWHIDSHHAFMELAEVHKPYKCDKCERSFIFPSSLSTHRNQHQPQEETYHCRKCNKKFQFKSQLERHQLGHSGPAHKCTVCSRAFTRAGLLKNHMAVHHDPSLLTCPFCLRKYASRNSLLQHLDKHKQDESLQLITAGKDHSKAASICIDNRVDEHLAEPVLGEEIFDTVWGNEDYLECGEMNETSLNVNLLHSILYGGDTMTC